MQTVKPAAHSLHYSNSTSMKRRLSVTQLSSENKLPTFRLNAPVVIRALASYPGSFPWGESLGRRLTHLPVLLQGGTRLKQAIFQAQVGNREPPLHSCQKPTEKPLKENIYLGARPVDHTTIPHGSTVPSLSVTLVEVTSLCVCVLCTCVCESREEGRGRRRRLKVDGRE